MLFSNVRATAAFENNKIYHSGATFKGERQKMLFFKNHYRLGAQDGQNRLIGGPINYLYTDYLHIGVTSKKFPNDDRKRPRISTSLSLPLSPPLMSRSQMLEPRFSMLCFMSTPFFKHMDLDSKNECLLKWIQKKLWRNYRKIVENRTHLGFCVKFRYS